MGFFDGGDYEEKKKKKINACDWVRKDRERHRQIERGCEMKALSEQVCVCARVCVCPTFITGVLLFDDGEGRALRRLGEGVSPALHLGVGGLEGGEGGGGQTDTGTHHRAALVFIQHGHRDTQE